MVRCWFGSKIFSLIALCRCHRQKLAIAMCAGFSVLRKSVLERCEGSGCKGEPFSLSRSSRNDILCIYLSTKQSGNSHIRVIMMTTYSLISESLMYRSICTSEVAPDKLSLTHKHRISVLWIHLHAPTQRDHQF